MVSKIFSVLTYAEVVVDAGLKIISIYNKRK